jgi:hypothetical protein
VEIIYDSLPFEDTKMQVGGESKNRKRWWICHRCIQTSTEMGRVKQVDKLIIQFPVVWLLDLS